MAPKKGAKGGKKKDEGPVEDEVTILKRRAADREAEIAQLQEKLKALEEESQQLAGSIAQIREDSVERGERFQDIIVYLTGQVKIKGERTAVLDKELEVLQAEKAESAEALQKEIQDLSHGYKFAIDDLQLQLADAQVQLRDLNEFTMTKQALEQETKSLKEQLEREKKEHQEAISDVERATLQERERLKKEMAVRIEDTRKQMIKQAHEQLHAKTKKTIIENEHLSRELVHHIKQTEVLLHKNEKFVDENIRMHRHILLAKELEEDLKRRNGTYQKTMRMLVFKLREKYLANKMERRMEEDELQQLIGRNEALKEDVKGEKMQLEKLKEIIEAKSAAVECTGPAEEAMKFLYACIEDLEVERLLKARTDGCTGGEGEGEEEVDAWPDLPTSLDKLSLKQRKGFLKHLIRTALSLRAASRNFESLDPADKRELEASFNLWNGANLRKSPKGAMVSVEDILALPLAGMQLEDSIFQCDSWLRPTSTAAQTDIKDVVPPPAELF